MESWPDRHIPTSHILTLARRSWSPFTCTGPPGTLGKHQSITFPPFLPTPLFPLTQLGHPWLGKLPWLFPLEQALAATPCSNPAIAWGGQLCRRHRPWYWSTQPGSVWSRFKRQSHQQRTARRAHKCYIFPLSGRMVVRARRICFCWIPRLCLALCTGLFPVLGFN